VPVIISCTSEDLFIQTATTSKDCFCYCYQKECNLRWIFFCTCNYGDADWTVQVRLVSPEFRVFLAGLVDRELLVRRVQQLRQDLRELPEQLVFREAAVHRDLTDLPERPGKWVRCHIRSTQQIYIRKRTRLNYKMV